MRSNSLHKAVGSEGWGIRITFQAEEIVGTKVLWQEAAGHISSYWKNDSMAVAKTTIGSILWNEVVGVSESKTMQELAPLLKILILTKGTIHDQISVLKRLLWLQCE